GSESRPPMLNKENYVPWPSRLLRYAKSRPNGMLIHNSILNGPYVRRMIPEPGDVNHDVNEKKAKLFNEWERFTSNEGESIEPYYHRFLKLMNDLKRNKHFPEKIASNLKILNNLQPEWSRHNEVDELKAERPAKTQDPLALMANSNNPYAFPAPHQDQSSFNQNYLQQPILNPEDITDPTTTMNMTLALMAKAFKLNYSTPTNNNQRISSNPWNMQIAQPGINMGPDRQMQMVGGNGGNQFRQYAGLNVGNPTGYNDVIGNQNQIGNGNLMAARAEGNAGGQNVNQIRCYNYKGVGHYAKTCTVKPRRGDAAYLQTQLLIAQKEEAGIQLKAEEYDLMAAVADLDEIEEVNVNCILMANLQQASTSGTQTDSAPVYDTDGSAEVHENCDDNEIFNMFTQEGQYTELLEPIPESQQVPHNDNNVISKDTSVEQGGETVEQHPTNFEETRVLYESLYQNLAIKVEKVNSKMALGYQNPFYLKQAQKKQQSLYDGKVLLEKHDLPVVHDSEETLQLAQESRDKMKQMNKEIKPANYTKINYLSGVKSTIVTLQRVFKQRMTIETHNWASSPHQEFHKIVREEIFPIVNQVNARVQNFKLQFLKEAAKFVGDFKSLAKEADASLAKNKALELEIERLLKAVVSQDTLSVVQNTSVINTSVLQTELERTKERFENCIIKNETEYAKL
nr:hypothetical protein [Tanacetum cinerariifolium]